MEVLSDFKLICEEERYVIYPNLFFFLSFFKLFTTLIAFLLAS